MIFLPFLVTTAAFVVVVFAGLTKRLPASLPNSTLFALLALVYLVPVLLTAERANPDITNFQYTADLVRSDTFVYTAPRPNAFFSFHPYLPFQMFVVATADWVKDTAGIPFSVSLKIPAVLAVMATAYLLREVGSRTVDEQTGTFMALAYGLNPIVFGVTAYHGQFDAIPAFLALAAWFSLRFGQAPRSRWISATFLGLAVLSKTWPLILLPILIFRIPSITARIKYTAVVLGLPAIATLGYALVLGGPVEEIVREVREYQSLRGLFGYTVLLAHLPGSEQQISALFDLVADYGREVLLAALAVVTAIVLLRRQEGSAAAMAVLLTFYVFTPSSVHHYQLWVLPFALAAGQRAMVFLFTALVTIDMWWHPLYSNDWGLTPMSLDRSWVLGSVIWAFTALWLLSSLVDVRPYIRKAGAFARITVPAILQGETH